MMHEVAGQMQVRERGTEVQELSVGYRERVYAGWIGKCAGVRLGAPVENWTYARIRDAIGEIDGFLPLQPGKVFKPDDDTAFPLVLIRALERYGEGVTSQQIGETYLNYLGDQHGTLWWGGYGISSEHTAYMNLAAGIDPPLSGSTAFNGVMLSEQIGGQIFSDIWGLVAPGDPQKAADLAERASRVSHDGEAVYGGRFIAALVSLAFVTKEGELDKLIEEALQYIPSESGYAHGVRAVITLWKEHPDDWRTAFEGISSEYGYDRYPGEVPIIPNACVVVLALLYGGGDFSQALCIGTMAGWDTDCNVGNIGCVMGVLNGLSGIPSRWRAPMQDLVVMAGVIGVRNLLDIATCADLIADEGERIMRWTNTRPEKHFHFSYPGSTQGFFAGGSPGKVIALTAPGKTAAGDGGLRIAIKKLGKKQEAIVQVRTLFQIDELSANYYGASFSPKIYPGQRLTAMIVLGGDAPTWLRAGLIITDIGRAQRREFRSSSVSLVPGVGTEVVFEIPPYEDACIASIGVAIQSTGSIVWDGLVTLKDLTWDGAPKWTNRFDHAIAEGGAIRGWTYLRGFWRPEQGAYVGSGVDDNETYTGDDAWEDYSCTGIIDPAVGKTHLVLFRVQGGCRWYGFGPYGEGRFALIKKTGYRAYTVLTAVEGEWESGRQLRVSITAKGSHMLCQVNDMVMCEYHDQDDPYLRGQVGMANRAGCLTRMYALEVL